MDHGGMDHGGMDMGHKCNMNVGHSLPSKRDLLLTYTPDALHLGHDEPLHRLPLVAHQLDLHPPRLPRCGSDTYGRLRGCPRGEQEIRVQQRGIREQSAK